MPDFVQIGQPSSVASSLEIGSTLVPDQVDWGTDLLNQRYVQTVQAEGGILAVEQAPNRKIVLPFIFKGNTPDEANQYIQALQRVATPGNILDVRPEGGSWITRFDIEGGRVLAHRDIRYHRQGLMQGTLELSTRPWGYTPTWMVAASVAAQKPFIPFVGSVMGDLPAHSRWSFYFRANAGAKTSVGGLIIGQHQMPSYRTLYAVNAVGGAMASSAMETFSTTPSNTYISQADWAATAGVGYAFEQINLSGGDSEVPNWASSTRIFLSARFAMPSVAGGYNMLLGNSAGHFLSRPGQPIKPLNATVMAAQMIDFGEVNKTALVGPDNGVLSTVRLAVFPQYDTTVPNVATVLLHLDSMAIIPNAGVFVVNNPPNVGASGHDIWGDAAGSASWRVWIDTKVQRMWRTNAAASAFVNDITGAVRGGWPLLRTAGPSGNPGLVVGITGVDPNPSTTIPYVHASALFDCVVQYQPRWTLFR